MACFGVKRPRLHLHHDCGEYYSRNSCKAVELVGQ